MGSSSIALVVTAVLCVEGPITFTDEVVEAAVGGLACYRIETPRATYYLEKSGAGLARMVDRDGNDWLSFHPQPGSGAGGEYRGFPNAVHQQAGNYFHPRNAATDRATTRVESVGAERVSIVAEAESRKWACRYDFFPTHCTFTMTKMPAGFKYWALYEGTPGGQFDESDWWMTSAEDRQRPLTTPHEGDIPAPEWIAFGDRRLARAIVLWHHEDDEHPDWFYAMQGKMTVFGFGREGTKKFLDRVPQRISIGFVEDATHAAIGRELERSWRGQ